MKLPFKSLITAIIVAVGVWCVLWNPIEYLDNELGTMGVTVLGILILLVAYIFWHKKAF